jgi:hypothetical protein
MPTRAEALAELERVFFIIAAEYTAEGIPLPADRTAIMNAWRPHPVRDLSEPRPWETK